MEIAALCAYASLLMHLSRRKEAAENASSSFFVNSRSSGAFSIAMSLVVSCVGASATMGVAGMAFRIGTPAFWWLGAGAAGLTVLSFFLAAKVRESGSFTMPEMVEKLMGRDARHLVSVVILIAWTAILAAQFSALNKLLGALTGLPVGVCLGIGFALVVLHTMGGQAVVIRTDRVQFILLFAGFGALLAWLGANNPGWTAGVRAEALNEKFTPGDLAHYLFVVGGNYLVCPMLFGRFLSARSAREARSGGLLAAAGLLLCAVLVVAIGLRCRGLIPADTPPDAVLTVAIESVFPGWLAMLVVLTLISAVVSSADSCLVTSATVLSHDLLKTDRVAHCRLCVVGLGCLGAAMTFMDRGILSFLFMAYDTYVAGVVMPVFVAMLFAKRRPASPRFALAAIFGGGLLGLVAAVWELPSCSLAGMALSAALTLAGIFRTGDPADKKARTTASSGLRE